MKDIPDFDNPYFVLTIVTVNLLALETLGWSIFLNFGLHLCFVLQI
jgi:hypothetical protein